MEDGRHRAAMQSENQDTYIADPWTAGWRNDVIIPVFSWSHPRFPTNRKGAGRTLHMHRDLVQANGLALDWEASGPFGNHRCLFKMQEFVGLSDAEMS